MVDGDTSPTNSQDGFATNEQITFSVTGSPATVDWTLSSPTSSVLAKLSAVLLTVRMTPDVHGHYTLYALVGGVTEYVLHISVTVRGAVTVRSAVHYPPVPAATVPAPAAGGYTLFSNNDNSGILSIKNSANTVTPLATSGGSVAKAGRILPVSFAGAPLSAAVVFGAAFPDNDYAVVYDAETTDGSAYPIGIHTKSASGFTLSLNSNTLSGLVAVTWSTAQLGES